MGRLVADAGKRDWDELTAEYGAMLMEGLSVMGTRGKHVNVLQHLMGYLKNHLSSKPPPSKLGGIVSGQDLIGGGSPQTPAGHSSPQQAGGHPGKLSEDKQGLLGLIEDYRQGLLPLIVPLTLLNHHLNRYPMPDWVCQQVYLHPYPKELMLRNHV